MQDSLSHKLRAIHVQSLVDQATTVRDASDSEVRTHHAEILIRQAMYERTIGRITAEQESSIFTILAFAMWAGYLQNAAPPDSAV